MHRFLGFLSTMILFIEMINYAHADEGGEDAEGLRAGVVVASRVESHFLKLAYQDSTQDDSEVEVLAERVDSTETIKHSERKKRRLFIGISLEGGASTLSAFMDPTSYNYNYGPIVGWSLKIGRDPFAIELGQEKIFNRTPNKKLAVLSSQGLPATIRKTGMYVNFIRLKSRIVRLKKLHFWIGIGIDHSITKDKWICIDNDKKYWNRTDELGVHLQSSFLVKKWSNFELYLNIRSRHIGSIGFYPASYTAHSSHETRSISVKWIYLLYESSD